MKWVLRIVAILVALPPLGAAVLLAMGHRGGAGHMHASTEIQAPPRSASGRGLRKAAG
jgi:hypothetical protein